MRRLTSGVHGYPDLRGPYLHIFGNLGVDGIRLTDLAAQAQLSLATASELVSDLQALRYLERRAEGTDKRAKLIFPTPPTENNRRSVAGGCWAGRLMPYCLLPPLGGGCRLVRSAGPGGCGLWGGWWVQPSAVR
jgi:MarR family